MKFTMTEEKHPIYDAYRIMATEDSSLHHVTSGEFGGFLSRKENLDENSGAWVTNNAIVLGDSMVTGNALIDNGAVLTNVNIGLDSLISGITISDITFGNSVRIYGDALSIVIADKALAYRAITANKYAEHAKVGYIGYARFMGTIHEFQDYMVKGDLPDQDEDILTLMHQYVTIIENHLFPKK